MRLGVSNLAWTPPEKDAAYALLKEKNVEGLEIAPSLFFSESPAPLMADATLCEEARVFASAHGLQLCSLQSALFGISKARLFEQREGRHAFETGMEQAIALASRLEIPTIVLGSPKCRIIPNTMTSGEARDIWHPTFTHLSQVAEQANTRIALEPNPAEYGTNFCTTLSEAVSIVRDVDHPGLGVNVDLSALILNDDLGELHRTLEGNMQYVFHAHISVPFLKPIVKNTCKIEKFLASIIELDYSEWVSIEMVNSFQELSYSVDLCKGILSRLR